MSATTQKTQRAAELEDRVWAARHVADLLRAVDRLRRRAAIAAAKKQEKKQRALLHSVTNFQSLVTTFIFSREDPPDFVRMVLDALDGKLRGAGPNDDALMEWVEKAVRTGNRKAERTIWLFPFLSEIHDASGFVQTPKQKKNQKDAWRRRLKILGQGLSDKSGALRKSRSNKSAAAHNRTAAAMKRPPHPELSR